MAIAHDATTLAAANYASTGTQNTTHTAGANARAAVVLISQNGSTADQVLTVTYNDVPMNRVTLTNWTDTTEAGAVYIYWLDGITGNGSAVLVSMTTTGTASKRLAVSTMTTDNGKAVAIGGSNSTFTTGSNPTTTITGLTSGTTYYSYLVLHSGLQSMTTTPGTGWTSIYSEDLGSQGRGMARRTAVDTAITSLACTWTAGTSEDYVIAGIAFYEDPVVTGTVVSPSAENPAISPTPAAAGPTSLTKLARVPGLVTRTNLFTNPRFQTAATNVSAYTNTTVAWNSTETRTATGGSVQATSQAVGWHAVYLGGITVTAGRRYRVSLYCKQLAGLSRIYAFYFFDTTWIAPLGYQDNWPSSTSWERWSAEGTVSGTSIGSLFFGATSSSVPAGESFVVDDILIEELPYGQTGVTGGYFDGVSDDNAYAREISQGWNGTADASTSYISYIDPAAPAVIITPAATGAKAHFGTATGVTVAPTTAAVPNPIVDTASASVTISPLSGGNPAGIIKDITGSDKTYGTLNGGLGIDIAEQQGTATGVTVAPAVAAAGTATKTQTATAVTVSRTVASAGTASKSQAATAVAVSPAVASAAVATKPQTAVNVTVTPTTAATPSALTKSTTATGVTVFRSSAATLGAATKSTATTGVTVAPSPLASAVITDTGNALNTLVGQTVAAAAGGTAKSGTAAVTVTPTTAAAGVVADQGIANVTITPTSTATLGTVSKASTAAGVTVDTIEAASAIVTDTGVATSSVSRSSAAAGFVTDAATVSVTTSPTTAAALSRTALATAPNITVAPASAATPGGTAKSSTVAVTVVPTTTAAAGAVTKPGTAGGVTVAPTSTASAIVWKHEFLIPDALLSVTNLTGVVANIQDSPTAPDGTQLDPTTQTAIAVRMSFENPGQQLRATAGSQTIRVLVTDA